MENGSGSKRTRSEAAEDDFRTTPTRTAATASPHGSQPASDDDDAPSRDPALEEEMDRLGVDEDLKASLRRMSPEERAEVLDDIRRQEQEPVAVMAALEEFSQQRRALSLLLGLGIGRVAGDDEPAMSAEARRAQRIARVSARLRSPSSESTDSAGPERLAGRMGFLGRLQIFSPDVLGSQLNIIPEIIQQQLMGLPHDVDDMSYEQLLELQDRVGVVSKGLTPQQIQDCMNEVAQPTEGTCVVCQNEWQESSEKERSVELKVCHHVFHGECIEQWLNSNKICPVCKREVV